MLQANNGRQFNLAAKVIRTFLSAKGFDLKHSEALTLAARLTGHASYEAAQASLEGPAKGMAPDAQTWRQLAHAIGTLDEAQLDMPVQVSEGCDSDGNATFSKACQILMASADCISAGASPFADNQPVLLVEEFNLDLESEEARRIELQFEVASGEPSGLATTYIRRHGLLGAIENLNADFCVNIAIGPYLARSASGYWNADFGYVQDRDSATGYAYLEDIEQIVSPEPLTSVLYSEATDFGADE